MAQDPDFDLVRRCQSEAGHAAESAFEELFDAYRDRVFNLAVRILGNSSDAEDVTQEAFVTVFRKIRDFRFSSRFYTWLYRVVYNLCVDVNRRSASGAAVASGVDGLEEAPDLVRDPGPGPLDGLAEGEHLKSVMERALRRLSPPLRTVIVLRYQEEMQYSEIAQVLGCSVGTVKSRLSRAHQFLQETLRPS